MNWLSFEGYAALMSALEAAEAEVWKHPDDEAVWRVYADALLAANDPRGELMAVQLELSVREVTSLRERQLALIEAHGEQWLGADVVHLTKETKLVSGTGAPLHVVWRRGFPHRVVITGVTYRSQVKDPGMGEVWRALSREPRNLRFVSELEFGAVRPGDEPDWTDGVAALIEHAPPRLRSLSLSRGEYWDISSTMVTGLDAAFWAAVPTLRSLSIELGQIDVSAIDAPALESFELVTGSLGAHTVDEVTRARWPRLQRLSLYFGDDNYGGLVEPEPVARLLATPPPPELRHLGLCNAMFSDTLPSLLLASPWLPGLRSLDLSHGTLGPDGARVLLDHAAKFHHLETLDLSHAYLDDELQERLRATFRQVSLNDVRDPEDARYVSVSE